MDLSVIFWSTLLLCNKTWVWRRADRKRNRVRTPWIVLKCLRPVFISDSLSGCQPGQVCPAWSTKHSFIVLSLWSNHVYLKQMEDRWWMMYIFPFLVEGFQDWQIRSVYLSINQPRDYIILQLHQTSHYQGRSDFISNKVSPTLTLSYSGRLHFWQKSK